MISLTYVYLMKQTKQFTRRKDWTLQTSLTANLTISVEGNMEHTLRDVPQSNETPVHIYNAAKC